MRLFVALAVVVVVLDIVEALLGRTFPEKSIWFVPVSFFTYVVFGFLLRYGGASSARAMQAVAFVAAIDVGVGKWLATTIVDGPPNIGVPAFFVIAIVGAILLNSAVGALGVGLGSLARGTRTV